MNPFCPNCGQAILQNAAFCRNCGAALTQQQQQTAPQQTAARASLTQSKFLLPGAGVAIAVVAIAAFMLFSGGSDSPQNAPPPPVNLAKSVIPPTKVAGTSEDLASTISTLNKAQLNVMARTTSPAPVDPKVIDQGLQDVAADAMRVAEMANIMSQTVAAQATTPEQTPASLKATQQYDAVAQTAYAQLIEAQNLRVQLAQGQVELQQITQSISNYGAQMWNTGVTINSRPGNPFEPFLQGTPQVEIAISLNTAAASRVTVQLAPGLSGWVSVSNATYSRPMTIQLLPAPNYDPLDNELLLWMLTFDGQADPYFAQRYALSRMEQYRRGLRTDRIGITSLTGSNWTDVVVANERANGRYVNMYDLPDWGTMGLNFLLPRGIAVSELAQIQAGIIPSFRAGYGIGYVLQGTGAQDLQLLGLNLNGADSPLIIDRMFMRQTQSYAALGIGDLSVLKFTPGSGAGRGSVDVTFSLYSESPIFKTLNVRCNGVPALKMAANTVQQVSATLAATVPTSTLACEVSSDPDFLDRPAHEGLVFLVGTDEAIAEANREKDKQKKYWDEQRTSKLGSLPPLTRPLPPVIPNTPAVVEPPPLPPPPPNRLSCPVIKGTQYLSGEEADWYRTNCNTPPPASSSGPIARSSTAAGPVVSNSSSVPVKPQTSGGGTLPGGSSGATFPGGGSTGGPPSAVIPRQQIPQQQPFVPQQPAMPQHQPMAPQHQQPLAPQGGNSNNPNLNNNRMDCVSIAASGYYIPGGAEESWFKSTCHARGCETLRTATTQSMNNYERWFLVNKCPAAPSGNSGTGGAGGANPPSATGAQKPIPPSFSLDVHGNVLGGGTLGKPLDQGFIWRLCFSGSFIEKQPDGKTVTYTPYQAKMSLQGSQFVGADGCMDVDTTFTGYPASARVYKTVTTSVTNTTGVIKTTATARRP